MSVKGEEIKVLKNLLKELEKEKWIIGYKNEDGEIGYETFDAQELYTNYNIYLKRDINNRKKSMM